MLPHPGVSPMSTRKLSIAVGTLALLVVASGAMAYPKPSVYPIAWEYKFKYTAPKRITVQVPGNNVPQAYWYTTFTLTNKDIDDTSVRFLPVFELMTRDGKVIRSDKDVPTVVYDAVRKREGRNSLEAAD